MQTTDFSAPPASARRAADLPVRPRLADFIQTHSAEILLAWDEFAATVNHDGKALDAVALRDHAAEILKTIANARAHPQSAHQQDERGKGRAPRGGAATPAET